MTEPRKPPKGYTPEARRVWRDLASEWELSDAEYVVLGQHCESLMLLRRAEVELEAHGLTIESRGSTKANPAIQLLRIARSHVLESWRLLDLRTAEEKAKVGRPPGGSRNKVTPIWRQGAGAKAAR